MLLNENIVAIVFNKFSFMAKMLSILFFNALVIGFKLENGFILRLLNKR
jgi:formate dehydrogenase assembly factor FdhD